MSQYSRTYWSHGKQRQFAIEELNRFQLVEGYRKLKRTLDAGEEPERAMARDPEGKTEIVGGREKPVMIVDENIPANDAEVLACMARELERQGLDPEWVGGLKPGDDRLQEKEATRHGA